MDFGASRLKPKRLFSDIYYYTILHSVPTGDSETTTFDFPFFTEFDQVQDTCVSFSSRTPLQASFYGVLLHFVIRLNVIVFSTFL